MYVEQTVVMNRAGTPHTVRIVLFRLWQVIVHDIPDVGYVKPTASKIRAYQYVRASVGETIYGLFSLALVKAAVIGCQ